MHDDARVIRPLEGPLSARVGLPGSKSYTNRALLLGALAEGESLLEGALLSDDTLAMAGALRALGLEIAIVDEPASMTVVGCGGRIPASEARLAVGNAGTAARFLTAMACLGHGTYEIDGDAAMRTRPIGPLLAALGDLGAKATSVLGNGCPPVRIEARGLAGGTTRMAGGVSSQYLSALLMCGPCSERGVTIDVEGDLVSKPYLDMTAQAMQAFGATLENDGYRRFRVARGQRYRAASYRVEPDASAASYFFAAAAITAGSVTVSGLGTASLQGDLRFVDVLERMGCTVRRAETETEVIGTPDLRGIEVDMRDLSDTAQTLAAIAPFARGTTRITGIGFIRRKETDRIGALVRELNRLGIAAVEEADGIVVPSGRLGSGTVQTYDDHRMAMSFAVAGLRAPGIAIANPGCVTKTFPAFFDVLDRLRHGA